MDPRDATSKFNLPDSDPSHGVKSISLAPRHQGGHAPGSTSRHRPDAASCRLPECLISIRAGPLASASWMVQKNGRARRIGSESMPVESELHG